ncbi:MAG: hypothetical protein E7266_03835 [Lachnospiraceae bacterium]|nr:hypothetical protein [Lachnospiraceae bacterium]
MNRKISLVNVCLIINLISFFAIYVIPTGFTNANDIFDVNESGLFSLYTIYSWMVIGLLLTLSFVAIRLQKTHNFYTRDLITVVLIGVQIAIIWIFPAFDAKTYGVVNLYNELIDELMVWKDISSARMLQVVVILFVISTIVNCLIICISTIDIIYKLIKKEAIVLARDEKHTYDGYGKFFNIFTIVILSVYTLVVIVTTSINTPDMIGIFGKWNPMFCIAVLISCVLPLMLFYFLICTEWIKRRKWLMVTLSFVLVCVLMYFGTGNLLITSMVFFLYETIDSIGIILPILGIIYLLIQFPIMAITAFVIFIINKIKKSG